MENNKQTDVAASNKQTEVVKSDKQAKQAKQSKQPKKTDPNKKPNVFVRLWGKIKAIASELKKVTWPSFKTVMKQLGCVLVTVIIVLVVILLMDLGFQALLRLAKGDSGTSAALIEAVKGALR